MIVVTGVGRSGTSVVARTLHEDLGVPMAPDDSLDLRETRACPNGSYEDQDLRDFHADAHRKGIDNVGVRLAGYVGRRERMHDGVWGIKDPRILDFPDAWSTIACRETLVVCRREIEQVLDSWVTVTSASRDEAKDRVESRLIALDRMSGDMKPVQYLTLDFSEWRPKSWIVERLSELEAIPPT